MHQDHPRSRGEHVAVTAKTLAEGGSSPLTRGAPDVSMNSWIAWRIIPAHAGSTYRHPLVCYVAGDHPRSRGEHKCPSSAHAPGTGSSPLTRGARTLHKRSNSRLRIIPAHAGSTGVM